MERSNYRESGMTGDAAEHQAGRRVVLICCIIVVCYWIYAAVFIWNASFVVSGERFFSLADDPMISMRYAKNLAAGYGLVWNPGGERVEGFTNPLWVLYMTVFHLLPIASSKISLPIMVSAALFLTITALIVQRIGTLLAPDSHVVGLSAMFFTLFSLDLNTWSLRGFEVPMLALVVSFSVWRVYEDLAANRSSVSVLWLLACATLIRMDAAVALLGVLAFLLVVNRDARRRNFVHGMLSLTVLLAVQTVFRIWYFGDVLPNTYYLKMTGFPALMRISHGATMALHHLYRTFPVLLPVIVLFAFRRDKQVLFLAWLVLVHLVYSVYVGGDAWESFGGTNRFVSTIIPLYFILFSLGLLELYRFVLRRLGTARIVTASTGVAVAIFALFVFVCFNANIVKDEHRKLTFMRERLNAFLLLGLPLHASDDAAMVACALMLKGITTPQATIAVIWAGAIPYFSERAGVDLFGKCDRVIAHGQSKLDLFYPGHTKWDYEYSIGSLKPDVVVQFQGPEVESRLLSEDRYNRLCCLGACFFARVGSPNIAWREAFAKDGKGLCDDPRRRIPFTKYLFLDRGAQADPKS